MRLPGIALVALLSGCNGGVSIKSESEVFSKVKESISAVDELNLSLNSCPEVYESGSRGGCYWSRRDSTALAREIYESLASSGFIPKGYLKQNYLRWSASFSTKDKKYYIVMVIDTTVDAEEKDGERWQYLQKGFLSRIELSVNDEK